MTDKTYRDILAYFRRISTGTKWEGHLFAVGGCVRDEILHAPIHDVDIAVDLPNGGVGFARWLERKRQTIGAPVFFLKFGTAKLRLRRFPDEEIELVQTRAEQYTKSNSRCPEVAFGSIQDDCVRRDFTVNTLYRDITTGEILDMTGRGIHDIKEGVIRTPMDPYETFDDDPVRILRCLRFSARFGWPIDQATKDALAHCIDRLQIVSRERWGAEFRKMLFGKNVEKSLGELCRLGGLRHMNQLMAEMQKKTTPDGKSLLEAGLEEVYRLEQEGVDDEARRLAAFFSHIGMLRTEVRDKRGAVRYPRHEHVGANMAAKLLKRMGVEPQVAEEVRRIMEARGEERRKLEKQQKAELMDRLQKEKHADSLRRKAERIERHLARQEEEHREARERRKNGARRRRHRRRKPTAE